MKESSDECVFVVHCMPTSDDAGKAQVDEQALRPGACITAWHDVCAFRMEH